MLVLLMLLISRLINRSGLRISRSKVFSSDYVSPGKKKEGFLLEYYRRFLFKILILLRILDPILFSPLSLQPLRGIRRFSNLLFIISFLNPTFISSFFSFSSFKVSLCSLQVVCIGTTYFFMSLERFCVNKCFVAERTLETALKKIALKSKFMIMISKMFYFKRLSVYIFLSDLKLLCKNMSNNKKDIVDWYLEETNIEKYLFPDRETWISP